MKWWAFLEADDLGALGSGIVRYEDATAAVRAAVDEQRRAGAAYWRLTLVNPRHSPLQEGEEIGGAWLEGWSEVQPDGGGLFEPPVQPA